MDMPFGALLLECVRIIFKFNYIICKFQQLVGQIMTPFHLLNLHIVISLLSSSSGKSAVTIQRMAYVDVRCYTQRLNQYFGHVQMFSAYASVFYIRYSYAHHTHVIR